MAGYDVGTEQGLGDYARAVWRWRSVVVLTTLLVALVAYLVSSQLTRVYEAEAAILLSSHSASGEGLTPVDALQISTEIQIIRSRVIEEAAAEALPARWDEVRSVEIENPSETRVLTVTVRATDPAVAADAANAYARAYVDNRADSVTDRLAQLTDVLQPQISDAERRLREVEQQIADRVATLTPTSSLAVLDGLQQRRDEIVSELTQLRESLRQSQYNAAVIQGGAEVLAPARVPDEAVYPEPLRDAAIAALLGLMLGVGLALLRESAKGTLSTADEVVAAAGQLPVLGAIPTYRGPRDQQQPGDVLAENSVTAEAYRSLRTNVQFATLQQPVDRLLVTSAMPGEGKTETAVNLAASLARTGRRVVLLDGDLRRGKIAEHFGIHDSRGFSDLLAGEVSTSDVVHEVPVGEGATMLVVASGRTTRNPTELLGGPALDVVLDELDRLGDLVVIDSAPVVAVADAMVLSRVTNGALVVVRPGRTRRRALREALALCERAGVPVLGMVLTATKLFDISYGPLPAGRKSRWSRRRSGRRDEHAGAVEVERDVEWPRSIHR